jgi:hypothetical protein
MDKKARVPNSCRSPQQIHEHYRVPHSYRSQDQICKKRNPGHVYVQARSACAAQILPPWYPRVFLRRQHHHRHHEQRVWCPPDIQYLNDSRSSTCWNHSGWRKANCRFLGPWCLDSLLRQSSLLFCELALFCKCMTIGPLVD